MNSNSYCLVLQLRYSLQLCLAKKDNIFPSRCLVNCSSTEPVLMEMMSLLTRLSRPETPPWTGQIPQPFTPSVNQAVPEGGCKRGALLVFPFKKQGNSRSCCRLDKDISKEQKTHPACLAWGGGICFRMGEETECSPLFRISRSSKFCLW